MKLRDQERAWCLAFASGKEVEKCMHIKSAREVQFMERYPSHAASKTLSMHNLPKRLAVHMQD